MGIPARTTGIAMASLTSPVGVKVLPAKANPGAAPEGTTGIGKERKVHTKQRMKLAADGAEAGSERKCVDADGDGGPWEAL